MMISTPRFTIAQEPDGTWIIVHGCDAGLAWSGQCWVDREHRARLITFVDQEQATQYAVEVFGSNNSKE